MVKKLLSLPVIFLLFAQPGFAQHQYYKQADSSVVRQYSDSLNRTVMIGEGASGLLIQQFNYVLAFYPKMLVKNIEVRFKNSLDIVTVKPHFSSVFKAPQDRVYTITFSNSTRSTLDSVLLNKLSFNSQLGLIATQISRIEDFSTDHTLDLLGWYVQKLFRKARNRKDADAEFKTIEVGLGYQLLSLNKENEQKLAIDNWQNTRGYANYIKYTRNKAMKPAMIANFVSDLPVYVTQQYK